MTRRLALDHLTVIDAAPVELVELAAETGYTAICLMMEPMAVLPLMARFDLYGDRRQRADLRRAMDLHGIGFDVAYPFTLAGRTDVAALVPALECAAELGAGLANALLYDRDPARRLDNFGLFCDLAASAGLQVAAEFYPPSQVPSLAAALDLVGAINRPGQVGINVDLLHLMRSGSTVAELASAPAGMILYGQVADGPAATPAEAEREASSARLLAGTGEFDIPGFVAALPEGCPLSVEIPRDAAAATQGPLERAREAVASVRRLLP